MNLSLLIQTFNGYEAVWDGYLDSYRKHWPGGIQGYFGTNTPNHEKHNFADLKVIYSGVGEWSDRLISLLNQIPTDYVLYMQEDHWLTCPPPSIKFMFDLLKANNLLRLQLSPITHFYTLYGSSLPLYFYERPKSKYLVNHQPAIWDKKFLISCLEKNEDPWTNEYNGTCRLWKEPERIHRKLAIYPCNWHKHMCEKGKFIDKMDENIHGIFNLTKNLA